MFKDQHFEKKNLLKDSMNFVKRLDSKLFKKMITLCSWPFVPWILRKYFKIAVSIVASKAQKHTHLFFHRYFQVLKSFQSCYNWGTGVTETSAIKNANWFPCLPKRKILILGSHLNIPSILHSPSKKNIHSLVDSKDTHRAVRNSPRSSSSSEDCLRTPGRFRR